MLKLVIAVVIADGGLFLSNPQYGLMGGVVVTAVLLIASFY